MVFPPDGDASHQGLRDGADGPGQGPVRRSRAGRVAAMGATILSGLVPGKMVGPRRP